MNKKMIFSMVVALALPAMANAQSSTGSSTSETAKSAPAAQGDQQSSQARIDAALHAAAQAKIPVSLLRSKVQEGEAKHVPQQRIAAAVEARLEALKDAKDAMDDAQIENANDAELSIAADAVQAGVKANSLVKVYRTTPPERRVVAVAVLTDLVRLGRSSENALARVSSAARSNVALANLNAEVASQLHGKGLGSTLDAHGIGKTKIK